MYNPNPYMRAQVPGNNIIWVQGIEGAKAQQIQPNIVEEQSKHKEMFEVKTRGSFMYR